MKIKARAIVTNTLCLLLALIIASGGFFVNPPAPARADDPANPFITINTPSPLPSTPHGSSFSPDGAYLAVAGNKAKVYKRNCGATYSEVATLGGPSTNEASWDAVFSPDGAYLALALNTSGMCVYKRDGDSFTLLTNPTGMPSYGYRYAAWSPDGTYLVCTISTNERPSSGVMVIVKRSGDTLTKLANPDGVPTWRVYSPSFSPDGAQLAIGTGESPWVIIYNRSGDAFTKIADPAVLPAGNGIGVAYSPTGNYLAVAHWVTPFITIYSRSGDTFTKLATPAGLPPADGTGVAWSHDSTYLAMVSGRDAPVLTTYQRSDSTFTRLASPTSYPTEWSQWLRFGYDSVSGAELLAVPNEGTNKLLLYSLNVIPPCNLTTAATGIATTTATLNGTLVDKGTASPATLSFEYGLDTGYGSTVAGTPPSSSTNGQTFTGAISGLTPGNTYHFRAKAVTTAGAGYGLDQTFTTTNPAPPTFVSAATNVAGTVITITFNKAMANPATKHGEFSFKIGAAGRTFSAAALNATTTKIDLTVSGAAIAGGDTVTVSYTAGSVTAADDGVLASFTDQPVTNYLPALVKVETAADGSGTVVGAQSLTAGSTLTVYSITRDQFGTFVANSAATWSLTGKIGGVADGDLVGGGASAVMTGHLVGSGVIHAVISGLTSTDSGVITVTPGAAASLTVNQAPASTGSVDVIFTTQPWILVKDAANNPVVGAVVTASLASGGGALRTTLTATSDANGLAKFTDLGYDRTDAFQLHFAAGALSVNAPAFGPLAAGAATAVRVETLADGSGAVVPAQSLASGSTLTVYSITRDQFGNFVANAAPDTWSLTGKTGGVVDGDLVGGGASAVMTGHLVGSGVIHAAISGLTPTDSGAITVNTGAATSLTVNQAPASTGSVDVIFTTQPWILVKDAADNPVSGAVVTASLASGGGALRTTLTATSDANGLAKFTDLGYDRTDAFQLHFAAGALSVNATAFGPLTAGAATAVRVETAASGTGTVVPAQDIAYSSTLTVYSITRDQFGNFAANASADNWTLTDKTGGVVDGDLVGGGASAVMTGHLVGSGVIHASIGGLTSTDSGIITVIPNTAADILTFNFLTPAVTGAVDNVLYTVALIVPFGTNVTNLVPTITVSAGATVSPLSGVGQNFTSPVTYTVTAADGTTTQAYIVTVSVAPPPPPPPPPPPANPLIGMGMQTSHGGSIGGATSTTTTQTISLPNVFTHTASISTNSVAPGTPVKVTADIANRSTVNGNKRVTLYVNGQVENVQGITVNSGGSSKLTFYVTRSEPGDYTIYVDGVQAGSFKVESSRDSDIILWLSMAFVLASLILGMVYVMKRRRAEF